MQQASRTYLFAISALFVAAGPAAADDVPPSTDAPAGELAVLRGVQGPAGMLSAHLILDINLSADLAGKPVSLSPDLYYAVTDTFQLGLLHQGPLGWQTRPGTSLCLTGSDNGCPHVYDNVGFDAMYALVFGKTDLSAHASLFVDSIDKSTLHLALGFAGKARFADRAALVFDPKVAIALNDRDTNDDLLFIPLELEYQFAPRTLGKLLTGLSGDLSAFGDTYQIPLGVGVVQNLNPHIDLGLRFSFDNLLGKQPPMVGAADARSLVLLLNLRS